MRFHKFCKAIPFQWLTPQLKKEAAEAWLEGPVPGVRSQVALGLPKAIIKKALHVALGWHEAITRKALLPAEPQRSPESKDFFLKGILKNAISQVLQGYPFRWLIAQLKREAAKA